MKEPDFYIMNLYRHKQQYVSLYKMHYLKNVIQNYETMYLNLKQKAKRILKLTDKLIKQCIPNYGALDLLAQPTVSQGE